MAKEVETKYLVFQNGVDYSTEATQTLFPSISALKEAVLISGDSILQGYMPVEIGKELARIINLEFHGEIKEARLRDKGGRYYLTLKSDGKLDRDEFESEITKTAFRLYWEYTKRRIEKVRLNLPYGEYNAEIDVFKDRDLVLAEIEVPNEEIARTLVPLGKDVTDDSNYKNKTLARTDSHRKFILTGGPCSGKSRTIEYLASLQYPVMPESARVVIDRQIREEGSIVPWKKLLEFQLEVLHASLNGENELRDLGTVFLDRGIPDAVAYCIHAGVDPPTPLKDAIRNGNYKAVFVLDPLPYKEDNARKETPEEAIAIHNSVLKVYSDLGFSPIRVPANLEKIVDDSVRERAEFIITKSHGFN